MSASVANKQQTRIRLTTMAVYPMHIETVKGADFVSAPYWFDVGVHTTLDYLLLDNENWIGKQFGIEIIDQHSQPAHYLHGLIESVTAQAKLNRLTITVKPWFHFLKHTSNCRIFQEETVLDIVTTLFKSHHLLDYDVSKITKTYPKIPYLVQYNESDFNFISRILAKAGIFYRFVHRFNNHTLQLFDTTANTTLGLTMPLDNNHGSVDAHLSHWQQHAQITPNHIASNDYDPEHASSNLYFLFSNPQPIPAKSLSKLTDFHYPLGKTQIDSAKAQLICDYQSYLAHHNGITANTQTPLYVGQRLAVNDSSHIFFIQSMRFCVSNYGHQNHDNALDYEAELDLVSTNTPYSPFCTIKQPTMPSVQTAIVTAEEGTAITLNDNACIKVQFHWDRFGDYNAYSSCWVRVGQAMAGKAHGHYFIPRAGQEVIVGFFAGESTCPIILGTAYNSVMQPGVQLPEEKAISFIKTSSIDGSNHANAIYFNQQPMHEHLNLNSAKDFSIIVNGNSSDTYSHQVSTTINKGHYELDIPNGNFLGSATTHMVFQVKDSLLKITPEGIYIDAPTVAFNSQTTGALPHQATANYKSSHGWVSDTLNVLGIISGALEDAIGLPLDEVGVGEAMQVDGTRRILADSAQLAIDKIPQTTEEITGDAAQSVAEKRALAKDFYQKGGMGEDRIEEHISAIDYSKPVDIKELQPGKVLQQINKPGRTGNYFSEPGIEADDLGIHDHFQDKITGNIEKKVTSRYVVKKPTSVLHSTAAPADDIWSVPGETYSTAGGGEQYYTPNYSNIEKLPEDQP